MMPDLDALTKLFVQGFPPLNAAEQGLALSLYRMLLRGAPVRAQDLARTSRLPINLVSDTLSRWPGVFYDQAHAVIGFWGIAVQEMRHRLEVGRNMAYTWCAWDALFIPELLNVVARVTSTCAETGDVIELTVSGNGIQVHRPTETLVSFVVPAREDLNKNVTVNFCHFVHFLRDRDAGERWTSRHGAFLMTLEQAFILGRRVNHARYADILTAQCS